MMRVHHFNCGTMRPIGSAEMVCHVLLVETANSLVLIDSGFGLVDREQWRKRLGPSSLLLRPIYDPAEAAINQIRGLGFDPADVRDVVLTHFDADHVGGTSDFAWARVHLTSAEYQAAFNPKGMVEKGRYLPGSRAHDPQLVRHDPAAGEGWHGFASAKELVEISPGIVLISMPGHSRGHAAVAVETDTGWVLHAGDTFYHHGEVDGTGSVPKMLPVMERFMASSFEQVLANQHRLGEVAQDLTNNIFVINAHDSTLLKQAQAAQS